jgi:hypothetical protein
VLSVVQKGARILIKIQQQEMTPVSYLQKRNREIIKRITWKEIKVEIKKVYHQNTIKLINLNQTEIIIKTNARIWLNLVVKAQWIK